MFKLTSEINVGRYKAIKPISVKISKSIFDFVDKAVFKMPDAAKIMNGTILVNDKTDTALLFKEGDEVSIWLGYNDILQDEFKGFVTKVNHTSPVEIECEGYAYQLRGGSNINKVYINTTLKKVLQEITATTSIKLGEIPDVAIDKLTIHEKSRTEILLLLKNYYKLEFFFNGDELSANLMYLHREADVKYRLGFNVIKADELKLKNGGKDKIVVRFLSDKRNGEKVQGKVGSSQKDAKEELLKIPSVSEKKSLEKIAEKHAYTLSYEGYEGKIECFLVPYCIPGFRASFEDLKHPEKNGNYYVQATEVTYGKEGARRSVTIGAKLSSDVKANK
ncbi:MAG: hypothetical protein JO154_20555 [Chitinophaga sp.]|uniref:hypothetical protein n=1 Tax=Chitinophaga sp. TaxID=1869181 RepID=UPI0025BA9ADD|nr:hypothetical protein [Chitinophaga sp.]MBV8255004.1 hypothetical protein [Chitinophaga sp.]